MSTKNGIKIFILFLTYMTDKKEDIVKYTEIYIEMYIEIYMLLGLCAYAISVVWRWLKVGSVF